MYSDHTNFCAYFQRITTSPSGGSNLPDAVSAINTNSATRNDYPFNMHTESPSISPLQFHHRQNSNSSTTPSPAPHHQQLFDSQNINSPSHTVPQSYLESRYGSTSDNILTSPTYDNNSLLLNSTTTGKSSSATTTFDYLYEFSETRKVLEDFFRCPTNDDKKISECFNESDTGSFVST